MVAAGFFDAAVPFDETGIVRGPPKRAGKFFESAVNSVV
jgi:hypothetical protein